MFRLSNCILKCENRKSGMVVTRLISNIPFFSSTVDFGPTGKGHGLLLQENNKDKGSTVLLKGSAEKSLLDLSLRKSFTPDILTMSDRVKAAMLSIDPGSLYSDPSFIIDFLRRAILLIARVSEEDFAVIPINGSSSLATESVIRTMMPNNRGKLLIIENGFQSQRIVHMCRSCGIETIVMSTHNISQLQDVLVKHCDISGVVIVHCDPYSGYVMPVPQIGSLVKKICKDAFYLVEATVSFGAMEIDMENIDFLVSNSGKSMQGAPGIAFIVARKKLMDSTVYRGESLVMDLTAQYNELELSGRFRYTPPSHIINALKEALFELPEEGGVRGRASRYMSNNKLIKEGMREIGFSQLISDAENPEGYFTTAFRYPTNPLFVFREFRNRLNDYGFLLCDEEMTPKNSFCISNIGNLYEEDVKRMLYSVRLVCHDMRMQTPLKNPLF